MRKADIFQEEYKKLNQIQKEAVNAIDGPVVVVAGPGTGKTQILALRIANILKKTDTKSDSILALTFTNAGVISMRERLLGMVGDVAYRINIFTFHAFCEFIIKEFSFYFKDFEGSRVLSDLERVEIIESIIKQNKFEELVSFHDEFSFLNRIVDGILSIKKEGLSPEEFLEKLPAWEKSLLADENLYYKKDFGASKKGDIKPAEKEKISKKIKKAKELGKIFVLYQTELKKRGLYDFSDMILSVLAELGRNLDLKADLQEKYEYILVDEHQDTNEGQNTLLEFLTDAPHLGGKANIFTVGDEKQSIYRFQGASKETFSKFQNLYKDICLFTLKENYRSTQNILDGAHSLIVKSEGLEDSPALHANKKENSKIIVREFSNYKFELLHLAEDINQKIKNGVPPGEIAVLYRANRNVSDIKTILDFYQINYTIFSKDKILNDPNIRNLIYLLKVILDFGDDNALSKAFFSKFLNLDAYDIVKILDKYKTLRKEAKKQIFNIIEDKKNLKEIEVKNIEDFSRLAKILKELKVESMNHNFPDFFKIFLDKIGYIKYMVAAKDSRLELIRLDKLQDEIKRQNQAKKEYSLPDFIFFVDAFAKYNLDLDTTDPEIIEGVSLMTAHGSKGREFEYVYIINATRKSWEASRGGGGSIPLPIYQYDGDLEDERRLFYVAMTRAKKELQISYALTDNDGRDHEESQFVKEIESSFIEEEKMKDFERKNIEKLSQFFGPEKASASFFEPEYLRKLFFRRGLNVSALNNYLKCPKKYLYKNLIRIPDSYSPTLKFGDLIHKSLESFFSASARSEKILPKKFLLECFEQELLKNYFSEKDEDKFRNRGARALEEFYDQYHGDWNYRVKTEFNLTRDFELDNREVIRITGFVDKVESNDSDGTINIVDYKTGRTFGEKTKEEKADYERQIVFYHLLFQNYDENLVINKSTLDFVEKNKKGKFEQYSFEVTKEHLEKLREEINKCADEVLSMEFLKKGCGRSDCEWCELEKI